MIKKIEAIICAGENLSPETIHAISQKKEVVQARQIISYFAKKETSLTLDKIGQYFGKDHATALHSVKTVNNYIDTDSIYRNKIRGYQEEINKHKEVFKKMDVIKLLITPLENEISGYENRLSAIRVLIENIKIELERLNT